MPSPSTSPVTLPKSVSTPTFPVGTETTLEKKRVRRRIAPRMTRTRFRSQPKLGMAFRSPPTSNVPRPEIVMLSSVSGGLPPEAFCRIALVHHVLRTSAARNFASGGWESVTVHIRVVSTTLKPCWPQGAPRLHRKSTHLQPVPHILCALFLTPLVSRFTIRHLRCFGGCFGRLAILKSPAAATGGSNMQYLPGWTVQCINQECSARGHWLRAYLSGPNAGLEFCPSCGYTLQAVPPPIGPRLRILQRAPAARPPLRPRPR